MTNSKYVPKRRFKEFESDGEWEQKNLSSIADIRDGTHSSPKYLEAGHPFITSKNVANGFISFEDIQYISNEDFNEINKRSKVDVHDILMGMIGTVGNLALIRQTPFFAIKNVALIKYTGDVDYEFLYQALQTSNVNRQLKDSIDGGTQKFISLKKIRNLNIPFSNISEQLKIGKFFQTIDLLIQLHQHKLDKLKDLKKAYLTEMFPAEGERVPKRRFPGFEGEWEMTTLGETVKVTMGQSPDGTTYSDAPGDYILVQGNSDLENGWVKPRIWTTQITKSAEKGDIIMSVRAPAGQVGRTGYNVVIGRVVAAIKGNEFIYQLLVKLDIDAYWKQVSSGSTFDSLNSDNIKNAEIKVPSIEEQEKIGIFFHKLDNSISLEQQKLDKLNDLKRAYLNELFV